MRFEDFGHVREQGEGALRELLRSGDGPERVWAAWSLALQLGGGSVSALSPGAQPDPGVRSQLVVVLAGLAQHEALQTLAEGDPDPTVRANASDYLIRTAAEDDLDDTLRFLERRVYSDPRPEPVLRILSRLPVGWPSLARGALAHVLSHSSRDLRLAGLQYLRRTHHMGDLPMDLLLARLLEEQDPPVLLSVAQVLDPGRAKPALLAASERVRKAAPAVLRLLVDRGETIAWASLKALAQHGDPRTRVLCIKLCSVWNEHDALEWLGSVATSGTYRLPSGAFATSEIEGIKRSAHDQAQADARERIMTLLADPAFATAQPLAPALRQLLVEVDEELTCFLPEDLEYLDEGVDRDADVKVLQERRRLIVRALDSCSLTS